MDAHLLTQVGLGARAVAMRLALGPLVARRSLPDLLASLTPAAARTTLPEEEAISAIEASEKVVERLRVVPDTCLYRSLARYALLRRAGHPARFVMGLDPKANDIEGHAWVELHGAPVGEEIDRALTVTFSYPGPNA